MAIRIVVLDGITLNPGDNPWTEVESLGELKLHDRTPPEQVVERSRGADVLVVNKVRLGEAELAELPGLRLVTVTATGHDCVDGKAARARGIPVTNVPVYGTDSVAQHIMALLLHGIHRIDLHDQAIRAGEWTRRGDFSFWLTPLTELSGKTLGVVGFGRIGQRVAELAHAFGMRVISCTRSVRPHPGLERFDWVDLQTLARDSDYITLNCPLTPETRGLVNRQWLSLLKPTAVLINASRGPLVVEQDLAEALNAGRLASAALDVVSVEPMHADNPLLTARNCLLTPHLAWAAREARQRLMQTTAENIRHFLAGTPQNVVNG